VSSRCELLYNIITGHYRRPLWPAGVDDGNEDSGDNQRSRNEATNTAVSCIIGPRESIA